MFLYVKYPFIFLLNSKAWTDEAVTGKEARKVLSIGKKRDGAEWPRLREEPWPCVLVCEPGCSGLLVCAAGKLPVSTMRRWGCALEGRTCAVKKHFLT